MAGSVARSTAIASSETVLQCNAICVDYSETIPGCPWCPSHATNTSSTLASKYSHALACDTHQQKNAQRKNTLAYPGLTTVSLDRIITYMKYYYVMCQKGRQTHRAYVQLDSESADILHDHLEQHNDMCQVCDVEASEVNPDLPIK